MDIDLDISTEANQDTIREWVHDASAGWLTCEFRTGLGGGISIRRADGQPLGEACGSPYHGYMGDVYVPMFSKLTRRNRRTMKDVSRLVRTVIVRHDGPMDAYLALSNFTRRNRIQGV